MNIKKLFFLFLALLLPVLIFVFLKSFGKNEFEVAPLFSDSVPAAHECGAFRYNTPYTVPDSALQTLSWNKDSITVIVFNDSIVQNQHERSVQLNRIFTQFKNEKLQVVLLYEQSDTAQLSQKDERLLKVILPEEQFMVMRNCVFLLKTTDDAVIIDSKKRIRGQYNLLEREDADRMIMQEMNILFKRY